MAGICSCANPAYPSMGRPNCVVEQRPMAFPIIVPRYKADGVTRNSIDLTSLTLGDDIQTLIDAGTAAQERFYPFPRVENTTFERTDSVTEDAPSGRSYKIYGQGGIYTLAFELWAKDAVYPLLKQAENLGCSEFDYFYVSVDGYLWGELSADGENLYGYMADANTYDAFNVFATDTTVQKINVSWDLDSDVALSSSFAISPEILGYKATTLTPLIAATQSLEAASTTSIVSTVTDGFGTAQELGYVTGISSLSFTAYNVTTAATIVVGGALETSDGVYDITIPAQTASDVVRISANHPGYVIADATVEAI